MNIHAAHVAHEAAMGEFWHLLMLWGVLGVGYAWLWITSGRLRP